jgi:hypothetical protein
MQGVPAFARNHAKARIRKRNESKSAELSGIKTFKKFDRIRLGSGFSRVWRIQKL